LPCSLVLPDWAGDFGWWQVAGWFAAPGFALEYVTLAWNVAGVAVLAVAAVSAWRSMPGSAGGGLTPPPVRAGLLRGPQGPGDLLRPRSM